MVAVRARANRDPVRVAAARVRLNAITASTNQAPLAPNRPRASSGRTRRGSCAPRSPTICCAPPASSPAPPTPSPEGPRCDDASSTSRPAWLDHNADRSCIYPVTGPGPITGLHCGATPSDIALHYQQRPDHPGRTGPTGAHRKGWTDQQVPPAHRRPGPEKSPQTRSIRSVHGSRLSPCSLATMLKTSEEVSGSRTARRNLGRDRWQLQQRHRMRQRAGGALHGSDGVAASSWRVFNGHDFAQARDSARAKASR